MLSLSSLKFSNPVTLKFEPAWESPSRLVQTQIAGQFSRYRINLRICISNKFPDEAAAAGPAYSLRITALFLLHNDTKLLSTGIQDPS